MEHPPGRWWISVQREALPPHYFEHYRTREAAEERFRELRAKPFGWREPNDPLDDPAATIYTHAQWNNRLSQEDREEILQQAHQEDRRLYSTPGGAIAVSDRSPGSEWEELENPTE
jgi:hypothetical protein